MKVGPESHLLAVTILDSNNQILPITWGICAGPENKQSWLSFLQFTDNALVEADFTISQRETRLNSVLNSTRFAFISDRGSGLLPAVSQLFPLAHNYYCSQHLAENVSKECNYTVARLFRQVRILV